MSNGVIRGAVSVIVTLSLLVPLVFIPSAVARGATVPTVETRPARSPTFLDFYTWDSDEVHISNATVKSIAGQSAHEWPTDGRNRGRTRSTESPGPSTDDILWTFQSSWGGPPVVANGKVLVGSFDQNSFYALDVNTGAVAWSFPTQGWANGGLTVADGKVFAGSYDGLYCLDLDNGSLLWKKDTGVILDFHSVAVSNGHVIVAPAQSYSVLCLDVNTGDTIWTAHPGSWCYLSPAVVNGIVLISGVNNLIGNNYVYALNETDGSTLWAFGTTFSDNSHVSAMDGTVFVMRRDGATPCLYALDAQTGAVKWQRDGIFNHGGVAVADRRVYAASQNGYAYALDQQTGDIVWQTFLKPTVWSFPVVASETVYFPMGDTLYCLAKYSGDIIWNYTIAGTHTGRSCAAVADGKLFISPTGNRVYAFGTESVTPLLECNVSPNPTKVGHVTSFAAAASGGVPPYSWSWTVNGTVIGATQNTTYTFGAPGNYNVCVNLTDSLGITTQCCRKIAVVESTPPADVTDLMVQNVTTNSITLTWSAPGDDGNVGTAMTYDVRYSTCPITDANWDISIQVPGEPTPQLAGNQETFTVTGLPSETLLYFALKTVDEASNPSGISNVALGPTISNNPFTPVALPANLVSAAWKASYRLMSWLHDGSVGNVSLSIPPGKVNIRLGQLPPDEDGAYDRLTDTITLNVDKTYPDDLWAMIILHEMFHWVQDKQEINIWDIVLGPGWIWEGTARWAELGIGGLISSTPVYNLRDGLHQGGKGYTCWWFWHYLWNQEFAKQESAMSALLADLFTSECCFEGIIAGHTSNRPLHETYDNFLRWYATQSIWPDAILWGNGAVNLGELTSDNPVRVHNEANLGRNAFLEGICVRAKVGISARIKVEVTGNARHFTILCTGELGNAVCNVTEDEVDANAGQTVGVVIFVHAEPTDVKVTISVAPRSDELQVYAYCPVDLLITDPDELIIDRTSSQIPGTAYLVYDIDGDGSLDKFVRIPNRKLGNYLINVVPESGASPTDTYTLIVSSGNTTLTLAKNITVNEIPGRPYMVRSTKTEISPVIPATIDFALATLNLKSTGRYVTTYIELPSSYNVGQVDIPSIKLNGAIPALTRPTAIGDYDSDGIPDLMVKFSRAAVRSLLPVGNQVQVTITGQVAGIPFEGTDAIRVTKQ